MYVYNGYINLFFSMVYIEEKRIWSSSDLRSNAVADAMSRLRKTSARKDDGR